MGVKSFNAYLFWKLPSAWWCGVRLRTLDADSATTSVRFRWINQNPFRSMFWAVQGMAAELATGALVMRHIRESGKPVSMLVLNNKANFSKKAVGHIEFRCVDGEAVTRALAESLETGEGRTVWMTSVGRDEAGDVVSTFQFEWTLKAK